MAKGKHATALFEVMSQQAKLAGGKNGSGGGGGGIPTPKWWFNSKNRSGVRTIAPQEAVAPSEPEHYEDEEPVVPEVRVRRPAPAAAVMTPPLASSIDVPDGNAGGSGSRTQPVSVSVDRDGQQISLRMSYTSALIGGFSLFIALALAVLIGKSLTKGPSPAIANTSTQALRSNPPTPGVMNVQRGTGTGGANDVVEGTGGRATGGGNNSTGTRDPRQSQGDPRPPATFFTDDPHRQNGLNYAIIQSYPDKENADKAAEFLTKSGIACTVERNLPNWRLPWADGCSVVGIRGFAKVTNNPALEAYKKSIMEASAKFTNGRSRFAGFAPSMYSWKKSN